jgi:hypothetical protein
LNSAALAQRSVRLMRMAFSIAALTAGETAGLSVCANGGGGMLLETISTLAGGSRQVSNVYSVAPRPYTSLCASVVPSPYCSGGE